MNWSSEALYAQLDLLNAIQIDVGKLCVTEEDFNVRDEIINQYKQRIRAQLQKTG